MSAGSCNGSTENKVSAIDEPEITGQRINGLIDEIPQDLLPVFKNGEARDEPTTRRQ
jgi:hypothetical protein